ncbi:hypothetical protein P3T36_004233 [Kitasatospora sp. MAP12-15]|uniref:hypothetical protein n=1 Tax=unclassified Kitasatospora TaxID=2633591 RepID=UPI002474D23B|nr:hypothetical protein [Kitasatospora sp. MAP12-44]MDH6108302.1 hypothetical protein [Kitasatospora sp. MAP12-44]
MTQRSEIQLGPVVARFRGTLAPGGYLSYLAALALIAGVAGISTGAVLNGLYGLVVGALAGSPTVLGWRQEVAVHQQGFVWRRLTGTRTVLHTEIQGVRRIRVSSSMRGNYEVVAVTLPGGREIFLGRIQDAPRLARLLFGAEQAPMPAWQPPDPTAQTAGTTETTETTTDRSAR